MNQPKYTDKQMRAAYEFAITEWFAFDGMLTDQDRHRIALQAMNSLHYMAEHFGFSPVVDRHKFFWGQVRTFLQQQREKVS